MEKVKKVIEWIVAVAAWIVKILSFNKTEEQKGF